MKNIELSSGEYTYYKYFKEEVGKVIEGKPTGHGNDGRVVLYDKNNVLKLWYDELLAEVHDEYVENLQSMIDAKCNFKYIYTPKRLVTFNNEVVGYLMRYFQGRNLDNISDLTSFRALLYGLKKLENDILTFSKKGFKAEDIHKKNLMVNQKHKLVSFCLMDPDPWKINNDLSSKEIYNFNIHAIRKIVFAELFTSEIKEYIKDDSFLNELYQLILNKESVELSSFLWKLKAQIQKSENFKIRTLGDFQNVLRK